MTEILIRYKNVYKNLLYIEEILPYFLSLGLPRNVINMLTSDLNFKIFGKEFPTIFLCCDLATEPNMF